MRSWTIALSPIPAAKAQSISRRFSYAFIGVVTLFLCAFATTAIVVNMGELGDDPRKKGRECCGTVADQFTNTAVESGS